MKDAKTRQEFLELRAQGWSFRRISKQLNVSFNTLLNWSKELEEEITQLEKVEREALLERYSMLTEQRIEAFGSLLKNALDELSARDLTAVSMRELIMLIEKCHLALGSIARPTGIATAEELSSRKMERELNEIRSLMG